jgi:hypothetical protein
MIKHRFQSLFVLFLSLITYASGFCQYIANGVIQDGTSSNLQGLISSINNNNTDIEGSPYINETYQLAKISSLGENLLEVRYNGYDDQFEINGDQDKTYLLNKHQNDLTIYFLNSDKTYKTFNYVDQQNGIPSTSYFVVLNPNSDMLLLKKESVKFVEGKKGVTSYERDKPPKFRRNSDKYYYKIREHEIYNFPNNKTDLTDQFPEIAESILNFIKSNKIKTSREEDLIQLVSYINTLIK